MDKDKDEYFDIAGVEGDDLADEQDAVAEVAKTLSPEPEPEPEPEKQPEPPIISIADHAKSAAAGSLYPTEDPGDDTTVWSPRPGVIGRNNQGFRKIR